MGRELIVQVRDKQTKNVKWENYVCGRDDATNYIAQLVYNRRDSLPEIEEDNLEGTDLSDRYSLIFDIDNEADMRELVNIRDNLKDYADRDKSEIQKAKDTLEDLRAARRNCALYDEFVKFSREMDRVYEWLSDEDFSRADILFNYLVTAQSLAFNSKYKSEIIIELSE